MTSRSPAYSARRHGVKPASSQLGCSPDWVCLAENRGDLVTEIRLGFPFDVIES